LKAARERCQVTYEDSPFRKTTNSSTEPLKARRAWNDVF
jgi:hypothetical protein